VHYLLFTAAPLCLLRSRIAYRRSCRRYFEPIAAEPPSSEIASSAEFSEVHIYTSAPDAPVTRSPAIANLETLVGTFRKQQRAAACSLSSWLHSTQSPLAKLPKLRLAWPSLLANPLKNTSMSLKLSVDLLDGLIDGSDALQL
jgi:hypothetical protein